MNAITTRCMAALFVLATLGSTAFGADPKTDTKQPYTVAILAFSERGDGVKDSGSQVADLMFASLATNPNIWLVERDDLKKILTENELNLSGAVNANQAIAVGQLTGARIIVTGSVFKVRDKTYLVAKVIGTETSRVLGETSSGTNGIDKLSEELAKKVSKLIDDQASKLMPVIVTKKDILSTLKKEMGDAKRPVVYVRITEEHLGKAVKDPAAETEFQLICKGLGFTVTEKEGDADIVIKGEGFSEFATRRQNLISVKARLEVKAVDKAGKVIAIDRQTDIEVDLVETIAGKKALQSAALKIAERLLPKLIKK